MSNTESSYRSRRPCQRGCGSRSKELHYICECRVVISIQSQHIHILRLGTGLRDSDQPDELFPSSGRYLLHRRDHPDRLPHLGVHPAVQSHLRAQRRGRGGLAQHGQARGGHQCQESDANALLRGYAITSQTL